MTLKMTQAKRNSRFRQLIVNTPLTPSKCITFSSEVVLYIFTCFSFDDRGQTKIGYQIDFDVYVQGFVSPSKKLQVSSTVQGLGD